MIEEEMTLKDVARIIRKRLRNKWDMIIAVSGEPGTGKSTFSWYLGCLVDKEFDLEKNILYMPSAKMIKPKFESLKKWQVLNIDETSKALHRHNWYDKMQKEIARMYDTERYEMKCTIFNIPRFFNLAENFRNNRVKMWCHVLDRGVVSISMKDSNKFCDDPWRMKENLKIYYKTMKGKKIIDVTINDQIKAERAMLNHVGIFSFPPMSEEIDLKYDALKRASRVEVDDEEELDLSTKDKERVYSALWLDYKGGSYSKEELGKKYLFSKDYLRQLLKKLEREKSK